MVAGMVVVIPVPLSTRGRSRLCLVGPLRLRHQESPVRAARSRAWRRAGGGPGLWVAHGLDYSLRGPGSRAALGQTFTNRARPAGLPAMGHPEREITMRHWDSDPALRQLVKEHREGILGRREFLARLGATTAGAAAASLVG